MKFLELIGYLTKPERLKDLYQEIGVNIESEALLIYMIDVLNLKSEITIFEIEKTGDNLIFEKDGEKYFQLFPVDNVVELIESDLQLKDKGFSNLEIAQRLLEYRLNDA
jgi:hypothetical protein